MKVYLVDGIKVTKFDLPKAADDFYTFSYTITNTNITCLINFEKIEEKWYLKSNGIVNIYNNSFVDSAEVLEYKNYKLKIMGYSNLVNIYFTTFDSEKTYQLDVSKIDKITIGNNSCNICYFNNEVAQTHSIIAKQEIGWVLSSIEDIKYSTYVNECRIIKQKLKAGDTIFINGLRIIWMQDFMIINNPNNQVKVTGVGAYKDFHNKDNTKVASVNDEDQNYVLYTEADYFYHTPRIREIFEDLSVEIDNPPASKISEELPWYLKIGTTLTLLASSFYMVFNILVKIGQGNTTTATLIPQIVMLISMLIGSIIMPRVLSKYKKKKNEEYEKERTEKYTAYLAEKEKEIVMNTKRAVQIMNDNNLSAQVCNNMASTTTKNRNFWSREIISNDFLTIRLGIGTIDSPIKVKAPQRKFELKTDHLMEKVYEIGEKYKKINNAPITVSLLEKNISAFIVSSKLFGKYDYFANIMVQLVTLHSGADLKIVILTNKDNEEKWQYAKFLPHCWSEDKSFRYFASTSEEVKNVSSKLEEEFKLRTSVIAGKEKLKDENDEEIVIDSKSTYGNFSTYFLIICDDYKNNERIQIIDDILNSKQNVGFSVCILTDTLKKLPVQCDTFVEIGSKDGCIMSRDISINNQPKFLVEYDNSIDLRDISSKVLNIPLVPKEGLSVLPQSISFLEVYGVSKIEQLNILNRWRTNNPVLSLSTPIGVYANGDIFKLDLHEKYHGPHGLIAGTTGSGKSEFIISYILSMCCNFHPYEVQFVLIDYKGGGLAGAFENRETGVSIPHLAGTITNLDTASMNRTLVSIQSELKRRQKIFNKTRDSLGEGTVDIYKYQKFYREGIVQEPLPHLFIISDEFAELKSQQPEFMGELISTARIGRSLGVHLVLATQKPSGVVNDQIWSNSKFKICLKVQDKSDSMEVLKKPDAASIKEAGRFYLQVGNDDLYEKGQSGWAGAKYVPSDKIIKKSDSSISFVNNTGDVIKQIKDIVKVETTENQGEQLTNIVKYIIELGKKEKLVTKKLWLDAIPEEIFIKNLKIKYEYKLEPYVINPIIGEYDSPSTQSQGLLTHNFNVNGNLLIAGKQGSGKENLINTLLLSSIVDHTPDEINFYIIDCGTESLRIYNKIPHVGDIAFQEDSEMIYEMFNMISKEIDYRKDIMADYAGSYNEYIKDSGNKLPIIVLIINNYDVFLESYSKIADKLNPLFRDGPRYGINFVISEIATNAIRGKAEQNFTTKFLLQLNDASNYRAVFGATKGLVPSNFFGRGLATVEDSFYEFQTAYLVPKSEINKFVREANKTYNQAYTSRAKKVPVIPNIVYDTKMYKLLKDLTKVPIGYSLATKEVSYYNFKENTFNTILTGGMEESKMSFLYALIKMFSKINNVKVKVLDFAEAVEKELENIEVYNGDWDNSIIKINNEIIKEKESENTNMLVILGVGMYKKFLSESGQQVFNRLLENSQSIPNVRFVIMDVMVSFRNVLTDAWYQKNVNNASGIWLDPDVSQQIIINAPNVSLDERKYNFPEIAFQVTNNKHTIIQHMVELLETEGEDDDRK